MTSENIKKYIEEAHANAVEKGFYPEGKEKNIGELLMLIISELGEALEAHRCGRFSDTSKGLYDLDDYIKGLHEEHQVLFCQYFDTNIKDTFEDEIADVFIRLFDLCGYLGIEPDRETLTSTPKIHENIGECFLKLSYEVSFLCCSDSHNPQWLDERNYGFIFAYLRDFCQRHNIPIEKHIEAKMAYNKTRPRKHGKEY